MWHDNIGALSYYFSFSFHMKYFILKSTEHSHIPSKILNPEWIGCKVLRRNHWDNYHGNKIKVQMLPQGISSHLVHNEENVSCILNFMYNTKYFLNFLL